MKSFIFLTPILSVLGVLLFYRNAKSNVCKTFVDYYSNRDSNKNCYYNPEYLLETPEIIERHGYKVEIHEVTTKDGYIITLFRIPGEASSKPILLQHGYASNSKVYVATGKKSLAFILADEGYDVWLGNIRGTRYSSNHTTLGISEEEYWNFSFDELGLYDLRAAINYIGSLTQKKVTYVGLSLGTLMMYVYGVSYPEEAYNRVDMFINFAPSVFLKSYGLGLRLTVENWKYIQPVLQTFSKGNAIVSSVLIRLIKIVCFPFPFQMRLCMLPLMFMFGFNYGQHDPETLPMILMQAPETPSLKVFSHGIQLAQTGMLSRFDYGNETNMKIYGSELAPPYDFSKMKVPTYIFRAKNDKVVTKENVESLYNALPNNVTRHDIFVVDDEEFSHSDFVFGKDVVPLVYNHVLALIKSLQ